jgi:DNA-directed RNA polymerase subunit RPC12/RpoP
MNAEPKPNISLRGCADYSGRILTYAQVSCAHCSSEYLLREEKHSFRPSHPDDNHVYVLYFCNDCARHTRIVISETAMIRTEPHVPRFGSAGEAES